MRPSTQPQGFVIPISGFTIVRNGVKLGFPVVESIRSLLPVCEEVIVNVGKSGRGKDIVGSDIDGVEPRIAHMIAADDQHLSACGLPAKETELGTSGRRADQ